MGAFLIFVQLQFSFTGAVTAMHDAIALANLFYAMPTKTSVDITRIFEDYKTERYPAVMESFHHSQRFSRIADRGIVGALFLFLITHMPAWLWRIAVRVFLLMFV